MILRILYVEHTYRQSDLFLKSRPKGLYEDIGLGQQFLSPRRIEEHRKGIRSPMYDTEVPSVEVGSVLFPLLVSLLVLSVLTGKISRPYLRS